ncbi:CKLF-like MARVEL transmembrane domain-containing protein 4 [Biomphalaria glabrata]|uniref:CKLF-like MARVEL transmembrane domain-containing protein 4 n=1 Tax=Biomphalaria glabrata TaxID=6526 RepID=A0A9W3AVP6_BIOGL|nr:CKLF-like MARVEL transmembrane domain-containing protein 4 [Biomphalaria glabrata]XP_055891292.1 CKLF-like MARVEL transmembrane domain-containing protein 4 [Biomphalaria glabrata]XP_055891293.1 CKLF-like MARVEL transmembrane domain-containing protein 4 [Biomphalaria glabrata]XP_055891295.1 CKLF-like MARVEL transmembrane domain-containing protein 4 [Biomphalaria glabrata]XP_055891296.1 CKLF-like MARVEL transmembrane domain-containing protein 4 [Biomphalaria glabrata]
MADAPTSQTSESNNVVYVWKFPIDRTFVKSINSILKVAAAILSLIAFICSASGRSDNCDDSYSSTYNYFEFVTMSAFITLMILWFLYALTLHTKLCFKLVPWKLVDLGYLIVYLVLYLIANIVISAQSCGKDSNKAAAAFGFFAFFCLCGHVFFAFREWRESRSESSANTTNNATEYSPDRNIEHY